MFAALIKHGKIKTTQPKAKAIKRISEKLITKSKTYSLSTYRSILSYVFLQKDIADFLFEKISPAISNRPGGYLRIKKYISQRHDNSPMCILEFVDYPLIYSKLKEKKEDSNKKIQEEKSN